MGASQEQAVHCAQMEEKDLVTKNLNPSILWGFEVHRMIEVIWDIWMSSGPNPLLKKGHFVLVVHKLTGLCFLLLMLGYPFQSHLKKRAFASEFKLGGKKFKNCSK